MVIISGVPIFRIFTVVPMKVYSFTLTLYISRTSMARTPLEP